MKAEEIVKQDIKSIADSIRKEAEEFEGKSFLISGGAGFLGNYFVATLLEMNKSFRTPCKIIVMDNFITGSKKNTLGLDFSQDKNVEFMEYDVCNPLPTNIGADYLIHAAGLASPFYYQKYPLETIEVATSGTKNFLEFAKLKNAKSILYFSSSEIYGDPDPNQLPTPETYWGNVSCTGPRACYDESKRLGETLCSIYYNLYQVPVKVVRPFNVYGPGMKIDDYRVIPSFMAKAIRGEALLVHDKGSQTRTFCYVTDAVQGFFKVLASKHSGEVFNIGRQEEEINILNLANTLSEVVPNRARVQLINYPDSYPAGEPTRRCPDISKARKLLNYNPIVDLKTGLARTYVWFNEQA